MNNNCILILVFSIFTFFNFFQNVPARGSAGTGESNPREGCRLAVAGLHLSLYDEKVATAALIERLSGMGWPAQAPAPGGQPGVEKNSPEHQMLGQARERLPKVVAQYQEFSAGLAGVFEVKTLVGWEDGSGYRLALDYTRECPPFKQSCALTAVEAAALTRLFKRAGPSLPPACKLYLERSRAEPGE